MLKVLYGCELSAKPSDVTGLSELDYWAIAQGEGEHDDLGYIKSVGHLPYIPKKYSEAWVIAGRRAGKSDALASTIVCYEAALGGHEAHIRKGQQAICFQIAQDLRMARYSLNFILATLESSPILRKLVTQKTADRIDLNTGITIAVVPPSLKAVRGYANPVSVLDEVGVWYQDAEAANPDYEIKRAVTPGQLQFPNRLIVGISSPWNKAGLLYKYFEAGTDGRNANAVEQPEFLNTLVWHGTTAGMGNPRVTKDYLERERAKDPRAFERECLAIFQDSISGFLSGDAVNACISKDVFERPPFHRNFYVAAIDPAFKRDAFALAICHADAQGGVVVDLVRRWMPKTGTPLNPTDIFAELVPLLKIYKVQILYSDQYHADTLQQLALQHHFSIESVPFTGVSKGSIYANLQQLVNQQRISLLDEPESIRELRSLERTLTKTGVLQIGSPRGLHDDLATVIALAAHKTAWMLPSKSKVLPPEPTYQERCEAQLARKRGPLGSGFAVWD